MKKKGEKFSLPGAAATTNYDKKGQTASLNNPSATAVGGVAGQSAVTGMSDSYGKDASYLNVAPQKSSLKIEQAHSSSGVPQSIYSKQIKIQQLYSEHQSSAAIQGQPQNSSIAQGILAGSASTQGQEHSAHQHIKAGASTLQSSGQQMALPSNQPGSLFTTRDQQKRVPGGLNLSSKQNSSTMFPTMETVAPEKNVVQKSGGVTVQSSSEIQSSAVQQMRNRSPHNNFLKWSAAHQSQAVVAKTQPQNPSTLSASGVSLALKMHTSDSKRHQTNQANPAASSNVVVAGQQLRATNFGGSVWNSGGIVESGNSQAQVAQQQQQRAAGKHSGLTYTQNEKGKFVDQTNNSHHWMQQMSEQMQGEEKTATQHSSIFSKAAQQQQFNHHRRVPRQSNYGAGSDWQMSSQGAAATRSSVFNQFINTPKYIPQPRNLNLQKDDVGTGVNTPSMNLQFGSTSGSNAACAVGTVEAEGAATTSKGGGFKATSTSNTSGGNGGAADQQEQFKLSSGFGSRYRQSMDAQQPKPQVINNQGHHQKRMITNRLNKGKQVHTMQDGGLKVLGFPLNNDQQLLTAQQQSNTMQQQQQLAPHDQSTIIPDDLIEMTPDQKKDIYKKRLPVTGGGGGGGTTAQQDQIGLKPAMHNKILPSQQFMVQLDQQQSVHEQHKRLTATEDSGGGSTFHRRAESMGKQKPIIKFTSKGGEEQSLEGFLQVHHFAKQARQDKLANRGKTSRKHNSFQGVNRPQLKNTAPFKSITTTSQFNESGNGSGGNLPKTTNLNTTTLSGSERDAQILPKSQQQSSQIKRRKKTNGILTHPGILNQNKDQSSLQGALSPTTSHHGSKLITISQLSQTSETKVNSGEMRMRQLFQEQKQAKQPPLSPKRTPINKNRMVIRDGLETDRHNTRPEESREEQLGSNNESLLHSKESKMRNQLRRIRKESRVLNGKVSSFIDKEQMDVAQLQQNEIRSKEHSMDLGSDDSLERASEGENQEAMAIEEGATPSNNVATDQQTQQEQTKSPEQPKEFTIEDEVVMTNIKSLNGKSEGSVSHPNTSQKEKVHQSGKQMHKMFSRASHEKHMESGWGSSDPSSFQLSFEQLVRESESLKLQLEDILRNRLSPTDPKYSEFIGLIVSKNQQKQLLAKSLPVTATNKFTFQRIFEHIENQKRIRSEKNHRWFHSDMSRSRFFENSMREDHPSITSPNFSGTVRGTTGLHHINLHSRHERKRRLHRYLSFSNGVTYHSAQAFNLLPELSNGGRMRNSFNHCGRRFGVSDSLSQRYGGQVINSSNSNQTVPTPVQQENKKVEDLQNATNRVQIVTTQTGSPAKVAVAPHVQKIYENLNMVDRKLQINPFANLKQIQQQNNFFPQKIEEKKIQGKVIEWQIGKQLGSGTTGEVYEALNINTGETFAVKMIKLMHPYLGLDQQKVKSVKKEIQRYKELNHKHLVRYYDSEIIENNVLCIYLEYVYKSIQIMCSEYGSIGEKNARMYTLQVVRALIYLHQHNVVHGDLKGANVLVSQDGKEIKLCDMGNSLLLKTPASQNIDCADSIQSLQSVLSLVASSPAWMAPETHFQRVGRKSDIWSLGCLVIEMCTGVNPWGTRLEGETNVHIALQRKLASMERPEIPQHVSEDCQNFIDSCLQHDAKLRPSAQQLLDHPWLKTKDH